MSDMSDMESSPKRSWRAPCPKITKALATLDRETSRGCLIPTPELGSLLFLTPGLPGEVIKDYLIRQYKLAVRSAAWKWVQDIQYETSIHIDHSWILDNLPHKNPRSNRVCRPKPKPVQEYRPVPMCKDVRLQVEDLPTQRHDMEEAPMSEEALLAEEDGASGVSVTSEEGVRLLQEVDRVDVTSPEEGVSTPTCDKENVSPQRQESPRPLKAPSRKPNREERIRPYQCYSDLKARHQSTGRVTPVPVHHRRCIIPGCLEFVKNMSRHVRRTHLPAEFGLQVEKTTNPRKLAVLNTMARWIGGEGASLDTLLAAVNYKFQVDDCWSNDSRIQVGEFGRVNDWHQSSWQLSPPNSPACLIHWRVAAEILCHLSAQQRQELVQFSSVDARAHHAQDRDATGVPDPQCVSNGLTSKRAVSADHDVRRLKVTVRFSEVARSTGTRSTHVSQGMNGEPEPQKGGCTAAVPGLGAIEVIDSHFHSDRMSKYCQLGPNPTIEDIVGVRREEPNVKVNVTGGVVVYCDPRTYPSTIHSSTRFITAIGVHPKKIREFTPAKEDHLERLLTVPGTALGEIGLDRTEPKDTWDNQVKVFKRLLTLSCSRRPLVLHLRDHQQFTGVYRQALDIMKYACAPGQVIHLHCFTGTTEDVNEWLKAFPRCHFGFTGLAKTFGREEVSGVRAVPLSRILLETDAPHLHPSDSKSNNSPAFLGDVAKLVAKLRQEDMETLIRHANRNAKTVYGMQ